MSVTGASERSEALVGGRWDAGPDGVAVVRSQTAQEQDAERGNNSAVTRETSNKGHMGFTAKGL